jgi:hypothetical protein
MEKINIVFRIQRPARLAMVSRFHQLIHAIDDVDMASAT